MTSRSLSEITTWGLGLGEVETIIGVIQVIAASDDRLRHHRGGSGSGG